MVRNEPSDRQDRAIQRRKLRAMWRSIREEEERLNALPVYVRKERHWVGKDPYVDVTSEFDRAMLVVLAVLAVCAWMVAASV